MSTIPDNLTGTTAFNLAFTPARIDEFAPRTKRWNRDEYYRLAELGLIPEKHVELIDGVIYEVSPHSFDHYWSIDNMADLLKELFGESYWVRQQGPCVHGEWSEPEPDVTVVRGNNRSFSDHPTTALLAVEISKSSLAFDRGKKASLYAAMGVPDYWIVDLEHRQLLVLRQPVADASVPFGHRYSQVESVPADGFVSPLEMPQAKVAVAQMLPPVK
jgi:Uma2 family endonuclease